MVTSALRSSTNQLNGSRYGDFPKFTPSVNPAEPILPVHYDSMVGHVLDVSGAVRVLLNFRLCKTVGNSAETIC